MAKVLRAFRGGIKPGRRKQTSESGTVRMSLPSKVIIPMLQHIGAPCTPAVKKGERVLVGQKIGISDAFVSAPVHSSVSGIVSDIRPISYSAGFDVTAVEIKPDGLQEKDGSVAPPQAGDREKLLKSITESSLT
mgnify:FL=1